MFQQELSESLAALPIAICPDCGSALHRENESLHCETHGNFFIYGSQLLVRSAPEPHEQPVLTLWPWQTLAAR